MDKFKKHCCEFCAEFCVPKLLSFWLCTIIIITNLPELQCYILQVRTRNLQYAGVSFLYNFVYQNILKSVYFWLSYS